MSYKWAALMTVLLTLTACAIKEKCHNAIDDDNDGLIDCFDPDCAIECAERCDNGLDDDDDGLMDCDDPDCFVSCNVNICGNGVFEPDYEPCEGTSFRGQGSDLCAQRNPDYHSGTLTCREDCTVDESACRYCGDGLLDDAFEECDTAAFGGITCTSLGYYGGTLACNADCTLDFSDCIAEGECGDGVIQSDHGEVCEYNTTFTQTCQDRGYWEGDLACASCRLDLEGCSDPVSIHNAGAHHIAAITEDGKTFCWGDNYAGQCGGWTDPYSQPNHIPSSVAFSTIRTGFGVTCGLTTVGKAYCWGNGNDCQLGNGGTADLRTPTAVSASTRYRDLASGIDTTCAISTTGLIYCWGDSDDGELGTGAQTARSCVPTLAVNPAGVNFVRIAMSYMHTCALDDQGRAWCWGENFRSQTGTGIVEDHVLVPTMTVMPEGVSFQDICAADFHSCALDTEGSIWCWGRYMMTSFYEYGFSSGTPVRLDTGTTTFSKIRCSGENNCALDASGHLWCWGENDDGEVGNGTYTRQPTPIRIGTRTYTDIAVGIQFACALDSSGYPWCWGSSQPGGYSLTPAATCLPETW